MNIALVDLAEHRTKLFPFTLTRPIGDLRVGILTIREKWEKQLNQHVDFLATRVLTDKFSASNPSFDLIINAIICPDGKMAEAILSLSSGQSLYDGDLFIAACGHFDNSTELKKLNAEQRSYGEPYTAIRRSWDIFSNNHAQIVSDYEALTKGRTSAPISDKHTVVYGEENIFIEEGVEIKAAILNAETGPIYLAKNSSIQEGATIRGPFALGENSRINMNAKIREAVTIGPNCKIGGEVSNAMIYGNSNKAHDGYLGNAVIGEWCNLGADTNNSNLKNNYDEVKVWDYESQQMINSGLQFCGLFMGDHSKTGINTMLNTGTTIGVCSNVFGGGFPPVYIPSFSWGGASQLTTHRFDKAITTAQKVMARKNIDFEESDEKILKTIFDRSIENQP